jgi:hypothetical protein
MWSRVNSSPDALLYLLPSKTPPNVRFPPIADIPSGGVLDTSE